jgi:hypothetical protein
VYEQTPRVAADGSTRVGSAKKIDESQCVVGRRPEGLCFVATKPAMRSSLGRSAAGSSLNSRWMNS